jgi:hypothetical protein
MAGKAGGKIRLDEYPNPDRLSEFLATLANAMNVKERAVPALILVMCAIGIKRF